MSIIKLKAAVIAIVGMRGGVQFNKKRGTALFEQLSNRVAAFLSAFGFDVRRKANGKIFLQLRDRKRERKVQKKIRKALIG